MDVRINRRPDDMWDVAGVEYPALGAAIAALLAGAHPAVRIVFVAPSPFTSRFDDPRIA